MSNALVFNSGTVFANSLDAVPTPMQIGVLQSASIDMKATTKDLYGQNILPVATGRSQIKVDGKFKFATYTGRLIRDFFGSTMTAGQTLAAINEAHNIPASTPFTVTSTNSATWTTDEGVINAATGVPLVAVASGPTTGQYSVSAGVYTFAAADEGLAVQISYLYTATGGDTITISNASAGAASAFASTMSMGYQGQQTNFTLNSCIPNSLKLLDSKIGDFSMPEYDFTAVVNNAGILGTISVPSLS